MDQRGFSIVEALVAGSISGIVLLATTSLMVSQQNQIRGLNQKQEMLDLKNMVLDQFTKPDVCSWQLRGQVLNVSMATSESSPSPTSLDLAALYQGTNDTSAVLARAQAALPGTQYGVNVQKITFEGIYATGIPNEYRGTLVISFDQSSLAHTMKPIKISRIITTNPTDPANAKRIVSCGASSSVPRMECATGGFYVKPTAVPRTVTITSSLTTPARFNEIFTVHESAGADDPWGLSCQSPYTPTTCGYRELGVDESAGPGNALSPDIWLEKNGTPGCYSDDEEQRGPNPALFLTCCRMVI